MSCSENKVYWIELQDGRRILSLQPPFPAGSALEIHQKHLSLDDDFSFNIIDWQPQKDQQDKVEGPATCSISMFLEATGLFALDDKRSLSLTNKSVFIFRSYQYTCGVNSFVGGKRLHGIEFRYPPDLFKIVEAFIYESEHDLGDQQAIFIRASLNEELMSIVQQVLNCDLSGLAYEYFIRAKALEVLARIVSSPLKQQPVLNKPFEKIDYKQIQLALDTLKNRLDEQWTITRLSRTIGINEKKLKSGFRQVANTTVQKHLMQLRLTKARELLASSPLSITEISLSVGFVSPSHFAKVFKDETGFSPRQWRNCHHNQ